MKPDATTQDSLHRPPHSPLPGGFTPRYRAMATFAILMIALSACAPTRAEQPDPGVIIDTDTGANYDDPDVGSDADTPDTDTPDTELPDTDVPDTEVPDENPAEILQVGSGGYLLRGVVLTPEGVLDPGEVL